MPAKKVLRPFAQAPTASSSNREIVSLQKRIRCGVIIEKLHKHIDGDIQMSATQIRAAEILLARKLPVLAALDVSSDGLPLNDSLTLVQVLARLQSAGWQPPEQELNVIEHDDVAAKRELLEAAGK